jgi:hypothetical protein
MSGVLIVLIKNYVMIIIVPNVSTSRLQYPKKQNFGQHGTLLNHEKYLKVLLRNIGLIVMFVIMNLYHHYSQLRGGMRGALYVRIKLKENFENIVVRDIQFYK